MSSSIFVCCKHLLNRNKAPFEVGIEPTNADLCTVPVFAAVSQASRGLGSRVARSRDGTAHNGFFGGDNQIPLL